MEEKNLAHLPSIVKSKNLMEKIDLVTTFGLSSKHHQEETMFKSFFKVKAETPLTPVEPVAEDIHKPEVNTSPGLTPDKQPSVAKAEAPKAPKVRRPPDVVLTTPMVYKVSAPEAIEKAEALMELVTDSRPDLGEKAAEVAEKLAELDDAASGQVAEENPVAPEAGAPAPEEGAPTATGEIVEGEKVKVTTEEGDQEGTAVKQNPDGTWEVSTKDGLILSKVPAESLELIPGARETMTLPATTKASFVNTAGMPIRADWPTKVGNLVMDKKGRTGRVREEKSGPRRDRMLVVEFGDGKTETLGDWELSNAFEGEPPVKVGDVVMYNGWAWDVDEINGNTLELSMPGDHSVTETAEQGEVRLYEKGGTQPLDAKLNQETVVINKNKLKAGEKPEEAVDGEVKVGEGKGKDPKAPLAGPASSGKPLPVAGPAAEPKPQGKIGSGEATVAEDGEVKTGAGKGSEPAVQTATPAKGGSKTLPVAGPAAEPKPEGKIGSGEATVATSGKGVSGSKGHFGFSLEVLNGIIAALKTDAKAPEGYEPVVRELKKEQKKHPKTYSKSSPFAIAWSMKNRGIKPKASKISADEGLKKPEAKPEVALAPEPKGEVKPAKAGEEKPAIPGTEGGPDLKASAFDKLDEIDLGGGYTAKKEKKKSEPKAEGPKEEKKEPKEPKESKEEKPAFGAALTAAEDKKPEGGRIVITKDGKEVGNYPDAFGDDSPAIIKFFRELLDIKEADDKKAGAPKSEGKEEPSIKDKFKALPKVEHRERKEKDSGMPDEKEMKELGAAKEVLENKIEAVQTILLAYRQKGYLVVEQDDIDATLLANQGTKMTLEAAMDAAVKMAAEKKQIELLALPDSELLTLRASLPYLKVRQMSVQASKPEGLTPLNILSIETPKSEGLSFDAAFSSHFGHLG